MDTVYRIILVFLILLVLLVFAGDKIGYGLGLLVGWFKHGKGVRRLSVDDLIEALKNGKDEVMAISPRRVA